MSEVTLSIAGKAFTVACGDGEEAHVSKLGAMIDEKLKAMGGNLGPNSAQNMLFAALLLADELDEARGRGGKPAATAASAADAAAAGEVEQIRLELHAVKAERDALAKELAQLAEKSGAGEDGAVLESLADKLEKYADALEQKLAAS